MNAMEAEISKVLKVKRKKGEDEQLYLARIVTTVQNVTNEVWEQLSVAAQRWCNVAAKAFDAKKDIVGFEDEEEQEQEQEEVVEAKPAPAGKKAAPGKVPAVKAAASALAAKKKKEVSMYRTIKQMIVKEPEITLEALTANIKKAGWDKAKVTTIQSVRADTRDTIRVLQDAGCLTEVMLEA